MTRHRVGREQTNDERPILATSAQGPTDPSFRVRLEIPAGALAAAGLPVGLMPLFTLEETRAFRTANPLRRARVLASARRRLRAQLQTADARAASTIIVQRQVDLAPSLALERAATTDRRLVYDLDDAVWLSGRQTMGHPLGVLKRSSRKLRWLAERADHVIAGNDTLAEYVAAHNDAVTVVPSLIDPDAYVSRTHEQRETITLGWVGSPTTAPYLSHVTPHLERFARESRRPVRLLVVGGAAPRPAGVEVVERPWSTDAEREALAEMDIGLMPLPDTPWSRGKCAYKALQYMASGIPPVVDDVGISAAVVADAGWVAGDGRKWVEGLHALTADAALRTRLGTVGRARVERDFSLARWLPTLVRILRVD